ncbi:hypothetical protein I0Q91_10850 [Halanaerobiaceae bacterium Z-7014]|uniref:Uncharacterized protein n=1 Tax=Halonatronomonas betaini TaxID=2778430 RepID=A0A931ARC7_9FIRM|nr:hypothetical protein [Halonatronomonas betaini]MBF8437583.1 hypothetical protein [Halonatronomonas betaini]
MTMLEVILSILLIVILIGSGIAAGNYFREGNIQEQLYYSNLLIQLARQEALLSKKVVRLQFEAGLPATYRIYYDEDGDEIIIKEGRFQEKFQLLDRDSNLVENGESIVLYFSEYLGSTTMTIGWRNRDDDGFLIVNNRGRVRFEF